LHAAAVTSAQQIAKCAAMDSANLFVVSPHLDDAVFSCGMLLAAHPGSTYEAMTDWLGFLHASDEYKVMALAAFGQPCHAGVFREIVRYRGEVDGTARVQTINRAQHLLYYDLLAAFNARTGVPILVNTSFNTRGEPMVNSPRDALESFWTSPLDALVIEPLLVTKQGADV
jgi:predicted NodU family carbamoyl transferase